MHIMYYCILCKQLHPLGFSEREFVFKSGFHYFSSNLYQAGVCAKEPYTLPKEQPATA
ncbi:hypothetical protein SK3146_01004 [Paenibacillus konkukensis]|uniref:DUF3973 domain-containing protein n=2 Tax=Paenibacillus TaxID=44249 RepID=A0ABY4RI72_9BACL|nr:hypothetical protein SK3146_01004 [Paenibacillus konkukensis]